MANFKALTSITDKDFYYVGENIGLIRDVEVSLDPFELVLSTMSRSELTLSGETTILRSQFDFIPQLNASFFGLDEMFTSFQSIVTSGLSGGNYNVTTHADATDLEAETDETDNKFVKNIDIFDAVDLTLWNLNSQPADLVEGDSFDLNLGLRNTLQQFGQDLGDYSVQVVLSPDTIYSTGDLELATFTLDDFTIGDDGFGGEEYELQTSITIPDNIGNGTYNIGLVLDGNDSFFEQAESNTIELWTNVGVTNRDVDLSVSDLSVDDNSMEDGETITGSFQINNTGTAGIQESVFVEIAMIKVIGTLPFPVELNSYEIDVNLGPGESTALDISELISQGATPFAEGEYQFHVSVSEDNNFDFGDPSESLDFTILPAGGNQPAPEPASNSDFDGNGYDDILFFNETTRKVGQFEMPDGSWKGIGGAGVGWEAVGVGLFDNDDTSADILWFNESTGGVGRFDMDGGTIDRWDGIGFAGAGWEAVGAGDFNGDGVDDILWFNEATGTVGQFRMIDTQPQWIGVGSTGSGWDVAGIADFNGDGIDDILWENANGSLGQFRMAADGSKEWASIAKMGAGWSVADTGKFYLPETNPDAEAADILVFNESTGGTGIYDLYNTVVEWSSLGRAGRDWEIQGTGDFNADGVDDILWRHDDGRMGQYQMSASQASSDYLTYDWDSIGVAGTEWDAML